jgi:hypothetical protein
LLLLGITSTTIGRIEFCPENGAGSSCKLG